MRNIEKHPDRKHNQIQWNRFKMFNCGGGEYKSLTMGCIFTLFSQCVDPLCAGDSVFLQEEERLRKQKGTDVCVG